MVTQRLSVPLCCFIVCSLYGCSALDQSATFEQPPTVAPPASLDAVVDQARAIQALQKQLRERDRHIAELRSQLDALKLIDEDHEKHRRVRSPASLKPVETHVR
jgi:hypothetical protein